MDPGSTPSWLVGLLIAFALATAATFGLLLYRHAEKSSLEEQQYELITQNARLQIEDSELSHVPPLLDAQISERRGKINNLMDNEKTIQQDVDRLVARNQDSEKAIGEAQVKELATYKQMMDDAAARSKELSIEEDHQFASERENDEHRRESRDEVEKLSQVIEEKKKEGRRLNAELEARIDELEARVRHLTEQQDLAKREFKAAGEIVASAAADGFVVINRGHHQNLRNGTKFVVFNKRGGRNIAKGEIQVIEVQDEIATARVLAENDKNDPLIVGDLLHNPIYDPDKIIHFAIRGDFLRFSKDELADVIRDSGGVIDSDITIKTDYLVAGGNSAAALAEATKLGVVILSEDQLLDFVTVRPHVTTVSELTQIKHAANAGRTFALIGSFTAADRSTIEKWLERNGGKTTGSVSSGVDIVIAGDGAGSAVAEARKQGIPVIDQGQFSHLDASGVDK